MNFIQVLTPVLMEVLGTILIAIIGYFGSKIVEKINTSKNLKNVSAATAQVIEATKAVVLELQQTCVSDWKANATNGKLTDSQITQLKEELKNKTIARLSDVATNLLKAAGVDMETIIQSEAEALILKMKNSATSNMLAAN